MIVNLKMNLIHNKFLLTETTPVILPPRILNIQNRKTTIKRLFRGLGLRFNNLVFSLEKCFLRINCWSHFCIEPQMKKGVFKNKNMNILFNLNLTKAFKGVPLWIGSMAVILNQVYNLRNKLLLVNSFNSSIIHDYTW